MIKNRKIEVQGLEIVLYEYNQNDYISITDLARYRDARHTDIITQNWIRNRNIIKLLGFWETIYNPDFNPLEFEVFKSIHKCNFYGNIKNT